MSGEEAAVVMTMGALHDGHVALIRAARDLVGPDGAVTVTIFVNPLQFGAGEDLERYPRTLDADLDICRAEGVDVVFAPDRDDMYPDGRPQVTVDPGSLAGELESAAARWSDAFDGDDGADGNGTDPSVPRRSAAGRRTAG